MILHQLNDRGMKEKYTHAVKEEFEIKKGYYVKMKWCGIKKTYHECGKNIVEQ